MGWVVDVTVTVFISLCVYIMRQNTKYVYTFLAPLGGMEALFLEHEGYLCALGCLLKSWEESVEEGGGHDASSSPTPPNGEVEKKR